MALDWRGRRLLRRTDRAAEEAIDATMEAAVLHAKDNHGPGAHALRRFESKTGELERSIRVTRRARPDRDGVAGRWGSRGVNYALRHELGFEGPDALGRPIDTPERPFLRPAAEAEYPKLAGRIRRELRRTQRRA